MLNCPALNGRGSGSSSWSVTVSAVSRITRRTGRNRGSIASAATAAAAFIPDSRCAPAAGRSVIRAIDIEQLQPGALEPLMDLVEEAFDDLVAEVVIGFTFVPQACAVEPNGTDGGDGARVELPAIGRVKPRPSEYLALFDGLELAGAAARNVDFQHHASAANHEQGVGLAALANQVLISAETHVGSAAGEELDLHLVEAMNERMLAQQPAQIFHRSPTRSGLRFRPEIRRANRCRLLGDVDPDRTPGDAASAPDASRAAELIDP